MPCVRDILGFVYKNKTTQILQFPGAISMAALCINSAGEVVGVLDDPHFVSRSFT